MSLLPEMFRSEGDQSGIVDQASVGNRNGQDRHNQSRRRYIGTAATTLHGQDASFQEEGKLQSQNNSAGDQSQAGRQGRIQNSIPENPFIMGAEPESPVQTHQNRFAAPGTADIPEWLSIARHNTESVTLAHAPRVQRAKRRTVGETADPSGGSSFRKYGGTETGNPQQKMPRQIYHITEETGRIHDRQSMPRSSGSMQAGGLSKPQEQEPFERRSAVRLKEKKSHLKFLWLASIVLAMAVVFLTSVIALRFFYEGRLSLLTAQRAEAAEKLATNHPFRYRELIETKAKKYTLNPAFVAAIVLNESSFDSSATSKVDARGLMQLMDGTAQWIWNKLKPEGEYSFDQLYSPDLNVEFGCWYLNYLSGLFHGDPVLVAAAYHAGQGEVSNWLNNSAYSKDGISIPLENLPEGPTKSYVTRVLQAFSVYQRLYYEGV